MYCVLLCKVWCLCSEDDPLCQDTALPSDLLRDTRLTRAAGGALLSREADEPWQLLASAMQRGKQVSQPFPSAAPSPSELISAAISKAISQEQGEPLCGGSWKTSAVGPGEGLG